MNILTIDELEDLCAKYQKLLRIQDWNIDIKIVHPSELEEKNTLAHVHARLHSMYATIQFADPEVMKDVGNMHQTLIHELLHVVFHGLEPSTENAKIYDSLWESGIDRTANAIYQLAVAVDADAGANDDNS